MVSRMEKITKDDLAGGEASGFYETSDDVRPVANEDIARVYLLTEALVQNALGIYSCRRNDTGEDVVVLGYEIESTEDGQTSTIPVAELVPLADQHTRYGTTNPYAYYMNFQLQDAKKLHIEPGTFRSQFDAERHTTKGGQA